MNVPHDARLIVPAGAAWVAAALVLTGTPWWHVAAVGGAVACVAAVVVFSAKQGSRSSHVGAAAMLACALVATTGLAVHAHQYLGGLPGGETRLSLDAAVNADAIEMDVTVVGESRAMAVYGETRFLVPVTLRAWGEGGQFPAHASATIAMAEDAGRGERLRVVGDLQRSPGDNRSLMAWDVEVVERQRATGVVAALSDGFMRATETLSPDVKGLVRGMLTGDTRSMSEAQVDDMRTSGLAHLTAVSGAHFAIVTMLVLHLCAGRGVPRSVRGAAVALAAAGFLAFVGTQPSVVRASGLAFAVALALVLGRRARAVPAMCVTVVVLMHVFPQVATEIGFAMSVVAVTAIVIAAPLMARRWARVMSPRMASALSIPVAAQLALLPLLVVLNPGIGVYSVLANVAAAPFLPLVMITGGVTVLTGTWVPALSSIAAHLCALAATPVARIAAATADAPGAWVPWSDDLPGIVGATFVAVVGLVALCARRRWIWVPAAAVASIVALVCVPVAPTIVVAEDADWEVVVCDVGQGDMMVVRAGSDTAVVIDTGQDPVAARDCLRRYGITEIPLLVLTHPDHDHDGAVGAVMDEALVRQAWISESGVEGKAYAELVARSVPVMVPGDGLEVQVGAVFLEVLPGSQDGTPVAEGDNDASIVVTLATGKSAVLALGDLEPPSQERLAASLRGQGVEAVQVDAVKVAHHGSAHQSEVLATMIDARWALISAGADNDYGHPAASTVAMYQTQLFQGAGATVVSTTTCGDLMLWHGEVVNAPECHMSVAR
ncbi:ComEC/Rec2 family competence protein [Demequina sediminicola]|uniref:ComEC/Rec2 family competence protein n=1 Tax=Demequina sediminicola TaxID=1095026 RepID=UPI000781BD0E|nr:ComEC/Rec2 family competence protein [Demequina sediminicola]